ncbi:hypothetical protein N0V88_004271 [Collariella sp. IMI 366227]|nr:hypothetical protein N0V88_004271 [Collariella sp. IMI 366227]
MPYLHFAVPEPEARRHFYRHTPSESHHRAPARHHDGPKARPRVEPPDFRLCVELGLLIRSRKHNYKSATGLAEEISTQLTRAGIRNHIADSGTSAVSSREWSITPERCIPDRLQDHRFGMKLVSPFVRFAKRPEAWQAQLRTVFQTLNSHFELTTSHQCYTHINVIPASGIWKLNHAKGLAKSTLYFERCLDSLVPPYRQKSVWAKSNRHNHYFGRLRMENCFAAIDEQEDFIALGNRMNWCNSLSPTATALGVKPGMDFQHETFRWSFVGLNEGDGLGPISFRQPPGSTSSSEVISWVMLVVCLARLSCGSSLLLNPFEKPELECLSEWLIYESEWCKVPHRSLLRDLISQATPISLEPGAGVDPLAIPTDDGKRLGETDNHRDLVLEKYRRLL